MNIFYKIRNLIRKVTLTQVNLVFVNVILIVILAMSRDLDHFVKVFGQIALSICMILNAVSTGQSDDGDTTELGDIDV